MITPFFISTPPPARPNHEWQPVVLTNNTSERSLVYQLLAAGAITEDLAHQLLKELA